MKARGVLLLLLVHQLLQDSRAQFLGQRRQKRLTFNAVGVRAYIEDPDVDDIVLARKYRLRSHWWTAQRADKAFTGLASRPGWWTSKRQQLVLGQEGCPILSRSLADTLST